MSRIKSFLKLFNKSIGTSAVINQYVAVNQNDLDQPQSQAQQDIKKLIDVVHYKDQNGELILFKFMKDMSAIKILRESHNNLYSITFIPSSHNKKYRLRTSAAFGIVTLTVKQYNMISQGYMLKYMVAVTNTVNNPIIGAFKDITVMDIINPMHQNIISVSRDTYKILESSDIENSKPDDVIDLIYNVYWRVVLMPALRYNTNFNWLYREAIKDIDLVKYPIWLIIKLDVSIVHRFIKIDEEERGICVYTTTHVAGEVYVGFSREVPLDDMEYIMVFITKDEAIDLLNALAIDLSVDTVLTDTDSLQKGIKKLSEICQYVIDIAP